MVNKNKFINSSFIVLEHDFPFCSLLLLLSALSSCFIPAKLFSPLPASCLFLLLFDLFWIYCLPDKCRKKRENSRVNLRKSICCPIKPSVYTLLINVSMLFIWKTWTTSEEDTGKISHICRTVGLDRENFGNDVDVFFEIL